MIKSSKRIKFFLNEVRKAAVQDTFLSFLLLFVLINLACYQIVTGWISGCIICTAMCRILRPTRADKNSKKVSSSSAESSTTSSTAADEDYYPDE